MEHVELGQSEGRVVATKRATDPAGAIRLQHEAEVLGAATHPGVVEVLAFEAGPPATLTTVHAGTRTLERTLGTTVNDAARLLASLATTIADLHDLGLSHGDIDPSHVIIDASGRPVLCGFSEGSLVAGPSERAVDVIALGGLIEDLAGRGRAGSTLAVHHHRLRAEPDGGCREALLSIADRIALASTEHPCSARSVARSLTTLADGTSSPPRTGARRSAVAALVGAAFVVLVGGRALLGGATSRHGDEHSAEARHRSTTEASRRCASTPTTGVDLDGDACSDALVVEGATVRTSAGRFVLGDDDDQVLVGDWDCDGMPTAALLRRPEGEVYVFSRWSTSRDVTASAAVVDESLAALRASGRRGCPLLLAMDQDGTARGVPLEVEHLPPATNQEPAP